MSGATGTGEQRTLAAAASAHALHDGYTDLLYLLLPVWQAEFGLGYAEVGMLRSSYTATMAALQIPSSLLAERLSPSLVLAGGTALAAGCFLMAGLSTGAAGLLAALIVGGVGASVQHPVASAMVARAYGGARSRAALGFYNFTGDVGKMIMPPLAAGLFALMAWRPALWVVSGLGLAVAALVIALAPPSAHASDVSHAPAASDSTLEEVSPSPRGLRLLLAIGAIDNAARSGFLTFLPFLLQAKGATLPMIALALPLVLAGGAAGTLVCGHLGARLGVLATVMLTEGCTAAGIVTLLALPLAASLMALPLIGVALNGTSSVLYGSVPELVAPQSRTRAFGIFYTGTIAASASAPPILGLFADRFGVPTTMTTVAVLVLATLPLAVVLNPLLPRKL